MQTCAELKAKSFTNKAIDSAFNTTRSLWSISSNKLEIPGTPFTIAPNINYHCGVDDESKVLALLTVNSSLPITRARRPQRTQKT